MNFAVYYYTSQLHCQTDGIVGIFWCHAHVSKTVPNECSHFNIPSPPRRRIIIIIMDGCNYHFGINCVNGMQAGPVLFVLCIIRIGEYVHAWLSSSCRGRTYARKIRQLLHHLHHTCVCDRHRSVQHCSHQLFVVPVHALHASSPCN